jgi:SOS regulatory protein LexA
MKSSLNAQQLNQLKAFYKSAKRMPSYSEVADLFGLQSKESAYRHIQKFITGNILAKDSTGKIIPGANFVQKSNVKTMTPIQNSPYPQTGIPLLGLVEAGLPSVAEESILDTISLDEWLIARQDQCFMLQVKGDSMIEAGIREGDYVVVDRSLKARIGDIVIAELDGGITMKYLRHKNNQLYLEPANSMFSDLYPEESLSVQAVVTAVVRKLI